MSAVSGARLERLAQTWRRSDRFILFVLAVALGYVLLRLSPSAYAIVFERMGVGRPGLYISQPRFLRSDEWAMWTPYIQAAVNNDFHRFNLTSIYHEDLRNFNVLPLRDWGLIFKPEMWSFFVFEPARAYSIFHASIMAAFVIGWYGFLAKLGFERWMAGLGSLLLFYSPYVQGWLTTTGPAVSLFPFIGWLFLSNLNPWLKAPLTVWLTGVWLIGHLYPPIDAPLAFAGAVLILAFRPQALTRWSHLAATVIGGAVGAALVWCYFRDVLPDMASTLYPGQRVNGGGQVEFPQWLAQILPNFSTLGEETFAAPNYLEAVTSATYLLVFTACFAAWGDLKRFFTDPAQRPMRMALMVLAAAFALTSIWELFPVPSTWGAPLLWNRAPARRFVFANGVMLLSASLIVLRAAPPVLTTRRFLAAAALVIGSYLLSRGLVSHGQFRRGIRDFAPLAPLLLLWLLRKRAQRTPGPALACAALASGVLLWGFYNPMQSSWPIFHRPASPLAARLQREAAEDPRRWVVVRTDSGAVLNGWGLPSVEHSLMRPAMPFFRKLFPHMPEDRFNEVFNRFASMRVVSAPVPYLVDGADIALPAMALRPALATPPAAVLTRADFRGGQVDTVAFDPVARTVTVTGWAFVSDQGAASRLRLAGRGIGPVLSTVYTPRPDAIRIGGDDRLAMSGFTVRASLATGVGSGPICAWADDPVFGRTWLNDAPGAVSCAPEAAAAVRPG